MNATITVRRKSRNLSQRIPVVKADGAAWVHQISQTESDARKEVLVSLIDVRVVVKLLTKVRERQ